MRRPCVHANVPMQAGLTLCREDAHPGMEGVYNPTLCASVYLAKPVHMCASVHTQTLNGKVWSAALRRLYGAGGG